MPHQGGQARRKRFGRPCRRADRPSTAATGRPAGRLRFQQKMDPRPGLDIILLAHVGGRSESAPSDADWGASRLFPWRRRSAGHRADSGRAGPAGISKYLARPSSSHKRQLGHDANADRHGSSRAADRRPAVGPLGHRRPIPSRSRRKTPGGRGKSDGGVRMNAWNSSAPSKR